MAWERYCWKREINKEKKKIKQLFSKTTQIYQTPQTGFPTTFGEFIPASHSSSHDFIVFHCTTSIRFGASELFSVGASEFFLRFLCNCLTCFITARITFTGILYPQCVHMLKIIYTSIHKIAGVILYI